MRPIRVVLPVLVCLAVAFPAPASAKWQKVSGGADTILTDLDQGLDGSRHAIFLQRREGAEGSAYDLIDAQVTSQGGVGAQQPIVAGLAEISAARLIPTAKGLVALVSGKQHPDASTSVQAYLAPLGGGAWAPVEADDAYKAAADTSFAEIAEDFTGVAAARIVEGPPLAGFPDGSLIVSRQSSYYHADVHRVLSGEPHEAEIQPPESFGPDCAMNFGEPATDSAGNPSYFYGVGLQEGSDGKCGDALVRQQLDPQTLQPVGAPVELKVPKSLGGAKALEIDPGMGISNNLFDAFTGPDGRPWAFHTIHVPDGGLSRVELGIWDANGTLRLVPRFKTWSSRRSVISAATRAKPAVRAFSNGDVAVAYVTSSDALRRKACPRRRRRCMYWLGVPAVSVARLHAGRWQVKEIAPPRFKKRLESFGALRLLGDSSKSLALAVESDVRPKGGGFLEFVGTAYITRVGF